VCFFALYRKTDYKNLNVILEFPEKYPSDPIVIRLTSKTLSDKLLGGLTKLCDEEAKKYLEEKQVSCTTLPGFVFFFKKDV